MECGAGKDAGVGAGRVTAIASMVLLTYVLLLFPTPGCAGQL